MKWQIKAAIQKVLGWLPCSEPMNHLLQRHAAKNIPHREGVFRGYLEVAKKHVASYRELVDMSRPAAGGVLEFGAGWDLLVALVFFAAGVRRQRCVDLSPLLRLDLVRHTMLRIEKNRKEYEKIMGFGFAPFPESRIGSFKDLRETLGIYYTTPVDMLQTDFPDRHFDFVMSSKVLEHVPSASLPGMLRECRRILKNGGVLSLDIDMQDHFSRFDRNASVYNFLRYEETYWSRWQSKLNHQNRLRLPDYIAMVEDAGFEILRRDVFKATEEDLSVLKILDLKPPFRGRYSWEDLGAKNVNLAARKK